MAICESCQTNSKFGNKRWGSRKVLKIANGYLPRVRLEYDRVKDELNSTKAELNSWKAELSNITRTYQQFVDRNIELKKREDDLQLSINELEVKAAELNESSSQTLQVPFILKMVYLR